MEKERFYTENIGPIKKNELASVRKALEICHADTEINEITLLIHTKNNTGYIERIFNGVNIKSLFNGAKIDNELPLVKIETVKTLDDNYHKKRVLVAFGLRSDELFKYDDFESIVAIIAHQWNENGVKEWSQTWEATEILSNIQATKMNFPHKVVQEAFNDLTKSINMSTGITHFMDEELCKTYLRALDKYEYALNSQEINAYLITELGWESDDVKDVIKLIDKLNSGSYFKGGDKTGLQNHIKRWKLRE
jgi:hypothetical protein